MHSRSLCVGAKAFVALVSLPIRRAARGYCLAYTWLIRMCSRAKFALELRGLLLPSFFLSFRWYTALRLYTLALFSRLRVSLLFCLCVPSPWDDWETKMARINIPANDIALIRQSMYDRRRSAILISLWFHVHRIRSGSCCARRCSYRSKTSVKL